MSAEPEPRGTLELALAHAARLLERQPAAAIEQAHEILKTIPNQPQALWLLATAWRDIGDQLTALGDTAGAEQAYAAEPAFLLQRPAPVHGSESSLRRPHCAGRGAASPASRRAIRPTSRPSGCSRKSPSRLGRYGDAETSADAMSGARRPTSCPLATISRSCSIASRKLEQARRRDRPSLLREGAAQSRLSQSEGSRAEPPRRPGGRRSDSTGRCCTDFPYQPKVWMSYGHALRAAGRQSESIDAYRRSIELAPNLGESYWSLAQPQDLSLHARRDRRHARHSSRAADLHRYRSFPLRLRARARRMEDAREFEALRSGHYARGQRAAPRGSASTTRNEHTESRPPFEGDASPASSSKVATAAVAPRRTPSSSCGLPRSGSTLVEQILSSHSQVEGTMELPDIIGSRPACSAAASCAREVVALSRNPRNAECSRAERARRAISGADQSPASHRPSRSSSTRCRTTSSTSD